MNAPALALAPAAPYNPSLRAQRGAASSSLAAPKDLHLPRPIDEDATGAPPLFYADDQPASRAVGRRQRRVTGLVGELLDAPNHAARQALMKIQLRALGFEWLGYGTVEDHQGAVRPLSFLTSYANEPWVRRYFLQRYHQVDMRPHDAPNSGLPLVWDLEALEQSQCRQPLRDGCDAAADRRRMLLDDLEANGIRSGIFFRLAMPGQMGEHTVISLLSPTPGRRWIDNGIVGRALMLGLSVHEYVSRHVRPSVTTPEPGEALHAMQPMSATQQSILEALLLGRSDKEIAYALGLSGHAVDYHMRQLRRRFGVHNRVQLVSAATDWQP